ncbi:MAG: hypothetical protein K6T83_16045 [Alicyclobacillus sp.]|nr:hypothetical protein [Alicyclobacillus sp.]
MRAGYTVSVLASIFSLAIVVGPSVVFAKNTHETKHIAGPATPHAVPPQLQGKPAPPNPDPGIVSPYSTKATDIGFAKGVKSSKNVDPGMTPQYPPIFQPPNAHPATPGQATKSKTSH